jgi:hypothetical protein
MKRLALLLLLASTSTMAAPRFVCKDEGPCFCVASTEQYESGSNERLSITCINKRTYTRTYYDSISQADWQAARQSGSAGQK